MSQRFFELSDDVYLPHRWDLGMPKDSRGSELDDWQFRLGQPVHIQEHLRVPIEKVGKSLDYTEAGVRLPVVHARVAALFAEQAPDDVQLIPVEVEGQAAEYFILVATRLIRCIDEKLSRFERWMPEDGVPRKVGQYSIMYELRIDKSKVGNARVFRCEGWKTALIVSEELKDALERMGATGTRFEEV